MSDAETIAVMTPAEMARALGGSLHATSESTCDRCECAPEKTAQMHFIIAFRAGEVTAASVLCLGCLMTEVHAHMRSQAEMDRSVEEAGHHGRGAARPYQGEGGACWER